MTQEYQITFGPFRLERPPGRLWRGDHLISLRPRSLAMLHYPVTHPGRLVTKAEVQQHVWAGTHITPNVLRVCGQEIRAALGDSAVAPRYLIRPSPRFLVDLANVPTTSIRMDLRHGKNANVV